MNNTIDAFHSLFNHALSVSGPDSHAISGPHSLDVPNLAAALPSTAPDSSIGPDNPFATPTDGIVIGDVPDAPPIATTTGANDDAVHLASAYAREDRDSVAFALSDMEEVYDFLRRNVRAVSDNVASGYDRAFTHNGLDAAVAAPARQWALWLMGASLRSTQTALDLLSFDPERVLVAQRRAALNCNACGPEYFRSALPTYTSNGDLNNTRTPSDPPSPKSSSSLSGAHSGSIVDVVIFGLSSLYEVNHGTNGQLNTTFGTSMTALDNRIAASHDVVRELAAYACRAIVNQFDAALNGIASAYESACRVDPWAPVYNVHGNGGGRSNAGGLVDDEGV